MYVIKGTHVGYSLYRCKRTFLKGVLSTVPPCMGYIIQKKKRE